MTNLLNLLFFTHYKRQLPLKDLAISNNRLAGKLQVATTSNTKTIPTEVEVAFMGPQDVKMIHPTAIARIVPFHQSKDFESNFFPYIEFKDPDFLWRYSQDTSSHPKPWLTLIALTEQEMIRTESRLKTRNDAQQQLLVIPRGQEVLLPEVSSPARPLSAHVQISPNPQLNEDNLHRHIAQHPEQSCCRLFCFRKLDPQKHYHLFLVPSYQIEDRKEGSIELTVFFHSEFSTAQKGDFEYLARKIKPIALDQNNSTQSVWCEKESRELALEAALAAPGFSSHGRDNHARYYPNGYDQKMIDDLNANIAISSLDDLDDLNPLDDPDNIDPYIGLPYYGKMYQRVSPLHRNFYSTPLWSQEINLDRRNRVAAAIGTKVVQKNQEQYRRLSWQQAGEVLEANAIIQRVYAGMIINIAFERRYNKVLTAQRRLIRSASFHSQFISPPPLFEKTLDKTLKETALIPGSAQCALLTRLNLSIGIKNLNLNFPWEHGGRVVSSRSTSAINGFEDPSFLNRLSKHHPYLKRKINVLLDRPVLKPVSTPAIPIPTYPQLDADKAMNFNIDFRRDALNKINHRISPKRTNFEPIAIGPEIDIPMYRPLIKHSLDYILPKIDDLKNNIKDDKSNLVTLCEENRYFIESYLLGSNHEMIHELLWQHFPIQAKATVFQKFWDSLLPEGKDDINRIQFWNSRLSENQSATSENHLVLLIKADLVRRYPDVVIYALKLEPNLNITPSSNNTLNPIFKANLREDIVAYGFNLDSQQMRTDDSKYYFVLEEPFDLPNFGLSLEENPEEIVVFDQGHYLKEVSHRSIPIQHSADFAQALLQRPVQMIQPASLMLTP